MPCFGLALAYLNVPRQPAHLTEWVCARTTASGQIFIILFEQDCPEAAVHGLCDSGVSAQRAFLLRI